MLCSPMDDQTAAALLGPDQQPFIQLMLDLVSNSNTERNCAEAHLLSLSKKYPDALCLQALHALCFPSDKVRFRAAILLRQFFTPTSTFHVWPHLSAQNQLNLGSILLGALREERIKHVARVESDTIAELASNLVPVTHHWPELLPFVLASMVTKNPPILVESSLRIFSQIAWQLTDVLMPRIITLRSILATCMAHPTSSDVRVAAVSATSSLVQSLPPSEKRDKLQLLLSMCYFVIRQARRIENENAVLPKVLDLLIDFAGAEPNFFCKFVYNIDIVRTVLNIAEDGRLEEGTRHLALEFVITLAEAGKAAPGLTDMLRRMPLCVRHLFFILMKMLSDVDDEVARLGAQSQSGNYTLALESLERLAVALGGNTVVKAAADVLLAYLIDPDWKKRHAGLIALSQISQGCSTEMLENLKGVVSTVLDSIQYHDSRVWQAAINTLGQLLVELGPDLQGPFHDRVLPALGVAMDDFENPCVQGSESTLKRRVSLTISDDQAEQCGDAALKRW